MSNFLDWIDICTEKSKVFKKFWNCNIVACCSSADFKDKFTELAKTIARKSPFFNTTIPSRTSLIGMNSCVAFAFKAIPLEADRDQLACLTY